MYHIIASVDKLQILVYCIL